MRLPNQVVRAQEAVKLRVHVGSLHSRLFSARVDPPVSDPIVATVILSLIDTALPDDDPPATRPFSGHFVSRSNGLLGLP